MFERAFNSLDIKMVLVLCILGAAPLLLFFDETVALFAYGACILCTSYLIWCNHCAVRNFRKTISDLTNNGQMSPGLREAPPRELMGALDSIRWVVQSRHFVSGDLTHVADDNRHDQIGLLAIIRSAVQPLRRLVGEQDFSGQRALQLADSAITRLVRLVILIHRDSNQLAGFITAPREQVSLSALVNQPMGERRETASDRGVTFVGTVGNSVWINAPNGVIQAILNNVFDAAAILAAEESRIAVTLVPSNLQIDLFLEADTQAPLIKPIDQIFERDFFSNLHCAGFDAMEDIDFTNDSPSLWNARHNLELIGGGIISEPRVGGGFSLHLWFSPNSIADQITA